MLLVLAVVGLMVAGIGVSFGNPTADATGDDAAEFVVSEENVTTSDRNRTDCGSGHTLSVVAENNWIRA